jgi:pyridinium-3,5-biscarboxylic acid mononucleotide synthase
MEEHDIRQLLEGVRAGRISVARAMKRLQHLPFEDLGFVKIDHHRTLRQGFAEVIYARGKKPRQVAAIVHRMLRSVPSQNILITRADHNVYSAVRRLNRRAKFYPSPGTITVIRNRLITGVGTILVVSAGTSDIPVAEEALVTAETMGNRVQAIYDVGVAGLHRLLRHHKELLNARVIICVAGMEGALPSVVAGLVGAPVIAVPTSTGYGASFGGLTALLAMLNSCASKISVVNIDNGFGAGCCASVINHLSVRQ